MYVTEGLYVHRAQTVCDSPLRQLRADPVEGNGVHALAAEVVRERAVILHVQKRRADGERLVVGGVVAVVVGLCLRGEGMKKGCVFGVRE